MMNCAVDQSIRQYHFKLMLLIQQSNQYEIICNNNSKQLWSLNLHT